MPIRTSQIQRLILLLALLWAPAGAFATTIVFVGNSFTYGELSAVKQFHPESVSDLNGEGLGGVPALFAAFARESHLSYAVSLETGPGRNLDFHYREKAALLDRPWDHVVLQPYSTLDEHSPGSATTLIDYSARLARLFAARNPQVDVQLVATWSRADQTYLPSGHWYGRPIAAMAEDLRAAADRAAAASGIIHAVIPVGEAWNNAIAGGLATSNPFRPAHAGQLDLWASDHYHGSSYGYYLEALVIFGSVTGLDPRSLGEREAAAAELAITPHQALRLQQIAAQTLDANRRR